MRTADMDMHSVAPTLPFPHFHILHYNCYDTDSGDTTKDVINTSVMGNIILWLIHSTTGEERVEHGKKKREKKEKKRPTYNQHFPSVWL